MNVWVCKRSRVSCTRRHLFLLKSRVTGCRLPCSCVCPSVCVRVCRCISVLSVRMYVCTWWARISLSFFCLSIMVSSCLTCTLWSQSLVCNQRPTCCKLNHAPAACEHSQWWHGTGCGKGNDSTTVGTQRRARAYLAISTTETDTVLGVYAEAGHTYAPPT